MLWPFEYLESFRCSISSVSICDAPESDLRVKFNDHLIFLRASVVQFRASRYIMCLNRTSELKVMTIWISRELLLLYFQRLDVLYTWIRPPSEKLWPFKFLESFRILITSVSIYYAPESDLRVKSYDHLIFSSASVVEFRASRYIMCLNQTSKLNLWPFEYLESFRCSISSVCICDVPKSELRVKSSDHLNCSKASIFQFRACRYFMCLNRTSELNVMTLWISREHSLFNFERLYMWCAWIGPPSEI